MPRLNYQSFAMLALTQGEDACRSALQADGVANPDKIAMKAAVQLSTMGAGVGVVALCNMLAKEFAPETNGPGRGTLGLAAVGSKLYRAQSTNGVEPWIRVPVSALGCAKGDSVLVTLEEGQIKITKG